MREWTVLVPVRRDGKSRLGDDVARRALTRAMVTDVVAAARECASVREVVVVVAAPDDESWLTGAWVSGAAATPCRTVVGGRGLNADLQAAAAGSPGPVVVVMADLAALTPDELATVLDHAGPDRGVVADATGTGTSLLLCAQGNELASRFGPDSFALHVASGAADLTGHAGPGARLDVDTPADLARLTTGEITPGPATAAALTDRPSGTARAGTRPGQRPAPGLP